MPRGTNLALDAPEIKERFTMSSRNWRTAFLLTAAVCALAAFGFAGSTYAQAAAATPAAAPIDDGWRRTATGWEQTAAWRLAATTSPAPTWRVDFHPAALALLQALVIGAAFRVFSGKTHAARNASCDET